MTVDQQIESAIALVASQPRVFSAREVAVSADMEAMESHIGDALRVLSTREPAQVLDVTGSNTTLGSRYLSAERALHWWREATLRWAKADVSYVTSAQLARSMASAFDSFMWETPPSSLLDLGRQWHVVSDGCLPDTFVFPWASLLQFNPRFESAFRASVDPRGPYPLPDVSLEHSIGELLSTVSAREASIIQLRNGLNNGRQHTLEEVGRAHHVTRERIRQIEAKALRKLRIPLRSALLLLGLAGEFMRSRGSLLIPGSRIGPEYSLALHVLGLDLCHIDELEVYLYAKRDISEYRAHLRSDGYQPTRDNLHDLARKLPFLSKSDARYLLELEKVYRYKYANQRWSRPRMVLEALRSIGRPAHYEEIAEKCNELFPDNQTSIRNWYGALTRESMEEFGVVWVGRRGMYALKEHGYSRPSEDLYTAIPNIVEDLFSRTQRPVSEQVVVAELTKDRRELNVNSVRMVLAFSARIESAGQGRYVPSSPGSRQPSNPTSSDFDLSAAFKAFTVEDDN